MRSVNSEYACLTKGIWMFGDNDSTIIHYNTKILFSIYTVLGSAISSARTVDEAQQQKQHLLRSKASLQQKHLSVTFSSGPASDLSNRPVCERTNRDINGYQDRSPTEEPGGSIQIQSLHPSGGPCPISVLS